MTKMLPKQKRRGERDETARRIYAYIQVYLDDNHIAPSMRDIAEGCYMSRSGILRYLDLLEAWGWITREPGIPRSISITNTQRRL